MQKVFGIAFIVIAIWVGLEVFTKGTDGAFGGALATLSPASARGPAASGGPITDRVRAKVDAVNRAHEARVSRQADAENTPAAE